MTRAAQRFVTPYTFELYSDNPVFTDTFMMAPGVKVPHINLTRETDMFLVIPATANILAKAAHGIADDIVSTALLACEAPIVFAPTMNERMWDSPAVRRSVDVLRGVGRHVLEPHSGFEIATMEPSFGAMPPFLALLPALQEIAKLQPERSARG
jgi:phosphopantothenoylcysteine decarboxylase/phosphopantothenate--cysteine ligase